MIKNNHTFSSRHKAVISFLSFNYFLSLVICLFYIFITPGINNWKSFLYVYCTLFSTIFMYTAVLYLLFLPFLLIKSKKPFYFVFFPVATLLQLFLITDLAIYKIFKFHINAVIINFFVTPGSWDSVDLGIMTILSIVVVVLAIIIFEWIIIGRALQRTSGSTAANRISPMLRMSLFLMIFVVVGDKLTFAVADILNYTEITRFSKLLPLYQPLTMKKFAGNWLGIKINRENSLSIDLKSSMLTYPLNPIEIPKNHRKPNIIWIVLDGYRYDMFNSEITPHIQTFSESAQVFQQHYSGGNATRFGLFSLFYGIYSYNWHQFLAERVSPVFMDTLLQLGYDFNINSSTSLTYPEFRKTIFVKMPGSINDEFDGENSHERDRAQIDAVKDWLTQRRKPDPFFSFIFLDAAHSRVYPPKFEKFKTDKKTTNYLLVSERNSATHKHNYMNSLWFLDHLIEELISVIKAKNLLENTVILITGDHGEEFHEHGFFGHNSAFTPEQIRVPMILYLPWRKGGVHPQMTSHNDVPATMFDLLGVQTAPSDYSNGTSMLNKPFRTNNLACSWSECSFFSDDTYINFSMETYNTGFFEVRDKSYRVTTLPPQQMQSHYKQLMPMIKEFSRFNQ